MLELMHPIQFGFTALFLLGKRQFEKVSPKLA
jgi:hypothetical protein